MNQYTISIIIPTFNSAKKIGAAIDSVVRQSFRDIQLIIVDGTSKDNTVDIVNHYIEFDSRIGLISESDEGIYDAMNKGIMLSKGEWIYFMGSDDNLYNDTILEDIKNRLTSTQCDVVYGDVEIIGDTSWAKNGERYDGAFDLKKLLHKNICHQSIFYRAQFIKDEIGFFNLAYKLCADWDFNLRCMAKTPFLYLQKIIAQFHGGGASTQNYADKQFIHDFLGNLLSYFNMSVFDPRINHIDFPYYAELIRLQKKRNYLKYVAGRINQKLF